MIKLYYRQIYIDTIIPKLNKACYLIRRYKLYLSNDALKMVYYAFFHSVMSYGLILGEIQLIVWDTAMLLEITTSALQQ